MASRRYAVVGTGAIGGLYGAKLAAAGFDVTFLARSDTEVLRSEGLHVTSVDGDISLDTVSVEDDPGRVGSVDVVLVTIKATGNRSLGKTLAGLVRPGTIVVLMQNGFGVEAAVAAMVPDAVVLGGLCFVCSTRTAPGRINHIDYGQVTIGEHSPDGTPAGDTSAMSAVIDDFQRAGVEMSPRPDLIAARWQKLVWNMPYNGLSVVLDAGTDEIMANRPVRQLVVEMMGEVVAAADAHGHPVGDGFAERMLMNTESMIPYATSMKLDFDSRRPLELAVIYDAPLALAKSLGVAAPRLEMLAAQLHFLDERNRR